MSRKTVYSVLSISTILIAAVVLCLSLNVFGDDIMTRQGDSYIINTTKLTPTVKGYAGTVPLQITIREDKIWAIKALPNNETPNFFNQAKTKIFRYYLKKPVDQALQNNADVCSGATYSSGAIILNIKAGLKYYKKHK